MTYRRGVLRCLAAAVLFGASAPAASALAGDMPTLILASLLYIGAALAVVPSCVRRPPRASAVRSSWRPLAVAVLFGGALGPALLVAGLAQVPAATASLLLNFELTATMFVAAAVFREHLGHRLILASGLITVAGGALVFQPGIGFSVGALLVIAACVCWGVDNSVTARIDQLSPQHVVLAKGFVAGVANLVLGVTLAGAWQPTGRDLVAALAVGCVGYGLSITLWVLGARDLGAARGQVIFAAAPFIGALIAWSTLGEPVTKAQLLSIPLAAAGVALSLRTSHEHIHRHETTVHEHEHSHDDGHHDHGHVESEPARHTHRHEHPELVHSHTHVPDLHHVHAH